MLHAIKNKKQKRDSCFVVKGYDNLSRVFWKDLKKLIFEYDKGASHDFCLWISYHFR